MWGTCSSSFSASRSSRAVVQPQPIGEVGHERRGVGAPLGERQYAGRHHRPFQAVEAIQELGHLPAVLFDRDDDPRQRLPTWPLLGTRGRQFLRRSWARPERDQIGRSIEARVGAEHPLNVARRHVGGDPANAWSRLYPSTGHRAPRERVMRPGWRDSDGLQLEGGRSG